MATLPYTPHKVSNRAFSTLAADMTDVVSTLAVASGEGARFPTDTFVILIDDEYLHVGSRSGDAFNALTRGYDGTTAAAHVANSRIVLPFGKAQYDRMYSNLTEHTHVKTDTTDFGHTHAQGDITSLVSDLAAKEATANKGVANGYASLDSGGKVPAAQLPAAGSDPWTYAILASDFPTISATAVAVTGMAFPPLANTRYEFEAILMVRTATATVGPRPGLAWATGMTDGVAMIQQTSAAGSNVFQNGNIAATVLAPVGGLPNATQSYPAQIKGMVLAGASPSSTMRVMLASETAGTTVTMKAGSFIRWRTV